jgi:hypothetical protein
MNRRRTGLLLTAGLMALLLLAALCWLLFARGSAPGGRVGGNPAQGTNPALNVRFAYSTRYLALAPYNGRAEFPLRLDAVAQNGISPFSFYGKRLGGLGRMLGKDPAPMLYDFAGQQSDSMFIDNYGLKPLHDPYYEDAKIGGKLALHQQLSFSREESASWPVFFPPSLKPATEVFIDGWTLFTADDLFYFYAIGVKPLEPEQRNACLGVLNSLKFNAVQASAAPVQAPAPEPAPDGVAPQAAPAETPAAPQAGGEGGLEPPAETPPASSTAPDAPAPR